MRVGSVFAGSLGILALLTTAVAVATGAMRTTVFDNPGSPAEITECGIRSYSALDTRLDLDIRFHNRAEHDIVALRIALTFFRHDAIDGDVNLGPPLLITWPRNRDSVLPSGGTAAYQDAIGQTSYFSSSFVQCSVTEARFADGTTWRLSSAAPSSAIAVSTPSSVATRPAQPVATDHPSLVLALPTLGPQHVVVPSSAATHPMSCHVTLQDGRRIAIPWNNPGCKHARAVFNKHPKSCTVTLRDGTIIAIPWENEGCAERRSQFAAQL